MYRTMAPLFQIARQTLLVGDPGQLPPLVQGDTAQFEAAPHHVHWATPREVLRRFADVPNVQLPASRRLPQDTVDLVQPSFYPNLPFSSAAPVGTRRMCFDLRPHADSIDRALDLLAEGATMIGLLLPATNIPPSEVDEEVAELMACVAQRLLERQAEWVGSHILTAKDIGCIDAHVASGTVVRRHLRRRQILTDELMVDTPEIWQGLERPLMIVKHTLSGLKRMESFSLEPGRWCVMLSRHQLGCIIVGRDGVGDVLDSHRHNCANRPMGADDTEWHGWSAHRSLWSRLEQWRRLVRV